MRRILVLLVSALCVLLQITLLPAVRPFGVVPNLMLVCVVLIGLEGTASLALLVAVFGGFVIDLSSGANFGMWTGVLVLAALVAGLVRRAGLELSTSMIATAMVAGGTIVMTIVVIGGLANSVAVWPVGMIAGKLAIELVLNLILTLGLRAPLRSIAGGGHQPSIMTIG